jgi:hypothetical protein
VGAQKLLKNDRYIGAVIPTEVAPMSDVHTNSIAQLANNLDATDTRSVQKFFDSIGTWSNLPDDKRTANIGLLTRELELDGKLPQLIITAGLADSTSEAYAQMKGSGTSDINRADLEIMAQNHRKGLEQVGPAQQLLATGLLHNIGDSKTGISYESSGHTFYIDSNKIDYKQIKGWAAREATEGDQRHHLENAMNEWDSLPGGAEKLRRDDIKLALQKDDEVKKLEELHVQMTAEQKTQAGGLTIQQRDAYQFMLDNFDKLRSIDNSGAWHVTARVGTVGHVDSYDDFVSKAKLEYYAKNNLHTSGDLALQHKQEKDQLNKDQDALDKAEKGGGAKEPKAEKDSKGKAEPDAKDKPEKESKEKAEKESKEKAEKESKEKAEKESKEKAEKESKEKAEKESKEKAEKESKEKAEKESKEKAEKESKEKAEKESKEKAEKESKEKAEKEANERAERQAKERLDSGDDIQAIIKAARSTRDTENRHYIYTDENGNEVNIPVNSAAGRAYVKWYGKHGASGNYQQQSNHHCYSGTCS